MFELHGVTHYPNRELILDGLRKLNQTHRLVHLHGCNWGYHISAGEKIFPSTYEVTYVLKDKYSIVDDYDPVLPTEMDSPTSNFVPEIQLGHWNKREALTDMFTIYIRKL